MIRTDLTAGTEVDVDSSAHSAIKIERRPDHQIIFAN